MFHNLHERRSSAIEGKLVKINVPFAFDPPDLFETEGLQTTLPRVHGVRPENRFARELFDVFATTGVSRGVHGFYFRQEEGEPPVLSFGVLSHLTCRQFLLGGLQHVP